MEKGKGTKIMTLCVRKASFSVQTQELLYQQLKISVVYQGHFLLTMASTRSTDELFLIGESKSASHSETSAPEVSLLLERGQVCS